MTNFIQRSAVMLSLLFGLFTLLVAPAALAATGVPDPCTTPGTENSTFCKDAKKTETQQSNSLYGPDGIITKATGLFSWLAGVIAVVMIVIAGFKYIIASGDSNNVTSAKNTLMFALVGLVIAASARAIVIFVLSRI